MIDTAGIASGFDIEVQLGGRWFATALRGLIASGAVTLPPEVPPATPITVLDVQVLGDDPVDDLKIELLVGLVPVTARARLTLADTANGSELTITTDQGFEVSVPFELLSGIDPPPQLTKVVGGADVEPAMVLLANLDLKASDQSHDPEEEVERGDATQATSFLPSGRDIAFGLGADTFPRLANDIWHTELTEDDGSHPLPDDDNEIGFWQSAAMEAQNGRIRIRLDGEVPIDWWPDADVVITIDLTPTVDNGVLTFELSVDSDVDTGILGDIFASLGGGLIGLLIGGPVGAGIGVVLGVIVIEVGEAIVEGVVNRQVTASFDNTVVSTVGCSEGVIKSAVADAEAGLALSLLNSVPRSVRIHHDNPDPLHERHVLVQTSFDEVVTDPGGFAAAGSSTVTQRFQPRIVRLVSRTRTPDEGGELAELIYEIDTTRTNVPVGDVLARVGSGDLLQNPIRIQDLPQEATKTLLDGTLASVCLDPQGIRRAETVITDVRFTTGLDLRVSEAVMLQDAGVLHLEGLQLIHPSNADPYFRSAPNDTTLDNFENLPEF